MQFSQAFASLAGVFLPQVLRKKVLNFVMRPFADPAGSVKEDMWLLRHCPLMPADISIHGLVGAITDAEHTVWSKLAMMSSNELQRPC